MFYELLKVINKGTNKKQYMYRDTSGNVYTLTSAQIKAHMKDTKKNNIFQGVKIDSAGRLVEDKKQTLPASTSRHFSLITEEPVLKGCDVYTGKKLELLASRITYSNRRYAVAQILDRLKNYQVGSVCVVKGIRRTGKTTAVLQAIQDLMRQGVPSKSICYITVVTQDETKANAEAVINLISQSDWEYVFIDEVTHIPNILNYLKVISDRVAMFKKVVLTGTDSYVWPMAIRDVLYGRTMPVDLTYMSLKEYCEVFPDRVANLSKQSLIDHFCIFGGVLNAREYTGIGNAYQSIQTAIVGNIVDTILRNQDHSTIKAYAGELYGATRAQITEAVIIAVLKASETQGSEVYRTQGIKIPEVAASIMEKQGVYKTQGVREGVVARLMGALIELNILTKLENFAKVTEGTVPSSKMELICHLSSLYTTLTGILTKDEGITGEAFENLIVSQVVQFASLQNSEYLRTYATREVMVGYCRYEVTGEALLTYGEKNKYPEADIVVRHRDASGVLSTSLVEVKKSTAPDTRHTKNMFLQSMRESLGSIDKYIVVYNGETQRQREVTYVNAVDFLKDIGRWVL